MSHFIRHDPVKAGGIKRERGVATPPLAPSPILKNAPVIPTEGISSVQSIIHPIATTLTKKNLKIPFFFFCFIKRCTFAAILIFIK